MQAVLGASRDQIEHGSQHCRQHTRGLRCDCFHRCALRHNISDLNMICLALRGFCHVTRGPVLVASSPIAGIRAMQAGSHTSRNLKVGASSDGSLERPRGKTFATSEYPAERAGFYGGARSIRWVTRPAPAISASRPALGRWPLAINAYLNPQPAILRNALAGLPGRCNITNSN
jgi:hypothetical protein